MLLSVIVPTRNRASRIADLLDSLAGQERTSYDWEVIVVDNSSTDGTPRVVREKQAALPIRVRSVIEPCPGLHAARHRGAVEARGEYIGYLDDDMVLAPTWLRGVHMLLDKKADAVVGRIVPKWEAAPPLWLSRMAEVGAFGPLSLLNLGESATSTSHFFGCNLFISKKTVFDLGGFHPDGMPANLLNYRGDGETGLWRKFRAAGMRLWYDPMALAYHVIPQGRMSVEYLRKRAYSQGVSDSFTQMRANGGAPQGVSRRLEHGARAAWTYLRSARHGGIALTTARAWNIGFQHHQAAARRDPALRGWTTRPDYLGDNARIPQPVNDVSNIPGDVTRKVTK